MMMPAASLPRLQAKSEETMTELFPRLLSTYAGIQKIARCIGDYGTTGIQYLQLLRHRLFFPPSFYHGCHMFLLLNAANTLHYT